jgi:hypothetical protein
MRCYFRKRSASKPWVLDITPLIYMDKFKILDAIKNLALANGGKAPGRLTFERQTGIRQSDWYPHIWLRWGDATVEAGYAANRFSTASSDEVLIKSYILLARELSHLPVSGEIKVKGRADKSFPSHGVFARFGGKEKMLDTVKHFCQANSGYDDILALLSHRKGVDTGKISEESIRRPKLSTGFVYLMKSGRHHKIGRTISLGSRERQLAIKIPIPPTTVHSIETDDPSGVEAYWHRRFAEKRGEGEWFDLSIEDINAFKRWRKIT